MALARTRSFPDVCALMVDGALPDPERSRRFAAEMAPLRALRPAVDIVGPMPYTALQQVADESSPHGMQNYWKAAFLDELSDEDKLTVARARRIQRFLSQPNFVAEQFTGQEGRYVKLEDTIKGFQEIIEGKHDDLPEQAFYMVGTIEEAVEKARQLGGEEAAPAPEPEQDAEAPIGDDAREPEPAAV